MSIDYYKKGWQVVQISDIAELNRGVSYPKEESSSTYKDNLLPVLRANNINGSLNFDDLIYVPKKYVKEYQLIKKGDIIFAMSSGSKHLVGKSVIAKSDFSGSYGAFCALLRINKFINASYVAFFFQSYEYRKYINNVSKGTNINNLKREHILSLKIPLPPLPEQRAIVAKIEQLLSELDNGIASLKKAQEQLKVYRQAVLKWAFEGKLTEKWREENRDRLETGENLLIKIKKERQKRYEEDIKNKSIDISQKPQKPEYYNSFADDESLAPIPDLWKWEKVGNICQSIVPNRDKPKSFTGNIPWLTTPDIDSEKITIDFRFIKQGLSIEEIKTYNARIIPENSVIMTCVGKFGIVCINSKQCVINQQLHAFITHQFINSKYLAYALKNNRLWFEQHATSTTVAYLNKTNCNSTPIPVCSLEEQQKIVQEIECRLSVLDKLEQIINENLQKSESLRQSILKKAFEGKLLSETELEAVRQDPEWEPAERLLERVKDGKAIPLSL